MTDRSEVPPTGDGIDVPLTRAIAAEETHQAERHDGLYRHASDEHLRLAPEAWEKFDAIGTPMHPYHATVLALGDVRGRHVLDVGCGNGWLSVILAKRGARVSGFDISEAGVATARRRAVQNGVQDRCDFEVASCYKLPYSDATFDAAIGTAILHHVGQKDLVASELRRVMKPGSRAAFQEPFGNSLLLERLRRLVPVRSMSDDPAEWRHQLRYADLAPFAAHFKVTFEEFHMLSRLDRVVRSARVVGWLARIDRALLRGIPPLRPYARALVVTLEAPVR